MDEALEGGILSTPMLLVTVCVILAVMWMIKLQERAAHKREPPGPWGIPLVGYLPFMEKEIHSSFVELAKKYGPVFQVYLGSWRALVINDLESAKQVLIKQSDDFADRPSFNSWQHFSEGKSISFNNYDRTRSLHKKIAMTALKQFASSSAQPLEHTVWEEGQLLLNDLLKAKGKPVDVQGPISLAIASVKYKQCFGSSTVARQDKSFLEFLEATEALQHVQNPEGNPTDLMPWLSVFYQANMKERHEVTLPMVRLFKQQRELHVAEYSPHLTRDITDALIKAADERPAELMKAAGLDRDHILLTLGELMSGGRATLVATLCWAILYMVTSPGVQDALQIQIDEELGDELPRPSDRTRMPYVEAFLLETWRCATFDLFLMPHAAKRDTTIYGYHVPKGTVTYVNMWSVSRDPKVWQNPNTFDPTRFLDADGKLDKTKSEDVLAFGAGKRRCLGELMARQESFILLVMLCKKLRFEKAEGLSYDSKASYGMTLMPQKNVYVVKER